MATDERDRRENLRLPVPPGFLKECAVWFGKDVCYSRMTLAELGRPHLVLGRGEGRTIRIADISIKGMRLSFDLSGDTASPLTTRGVLVYFKLLDPLEASRDSLLTLFMGSEIVHTQRDRTSWTLGLNFTMKIVPERYERAFTFFNVRKYGVNELARWCDAVSRITQQTGSGEPEPPKAPGIELESLLDEIYNGESD